MLNPARRALPFGVALAAVLSLTVASSATAEPTPWPQYTTGPLVQATEGAQLIDPPKIANTADVLAHAYGVIGAGSTAVEAKLRVRYAKSTDIASPAHTATLLDFDRDGKPEVLVDNEITIPAGERVYDGTGTAYVYDLPATADVDKCVAIPDRSAARFSVATSIYKINEGVVSTEIPLNKLFASSNVGALRNAPDMLTLATRIPPQGGTRQVLDRLPYAATGPACGAFEMSYDFSKATSRLPADAVPTATVDHTDPANDNAAGLADLTRVAVKRYTTRSYGKDLLVDGAAAVPARTIYPSDLSIDFAKADLTSSLTYVWRNTWTRTGNGPLESGTIRTEPASRGRVRVTVSTFDPAVGTYQPASNMRCLLKGQLSGRNDRSYNVALRTVGDGFRVTVPLDEFLDAEGYYGDSGVDGTSQFRFHTMSDPGPAGSFSPVDHVPFLAGYSRDGRSGPAGGCVPVGNGTDLDGAQIYPDRAFTVGAAAPAVKLTPSTTTPERGADVTFDLTGTGAGNRLCSFQRAFTPNDCSAPNLTQTYTQNATARLAVDTDAGPWDSVDVDIKIRNNRPTAAINRVGTTPPAGTDGSFAIVQGAAVSVPLEVVGTDRDPGTTFTYRWTLDGAPVATTDNYTPTFSAPRDEPYVVRAYVTDDSEDAATEESLAAEFPVKVVRSPQNAVSIVRPARVINGVPFDIAARLATGTTGYSALTWQWDLDGDADVDFDPARTTRELTNVVIPDASPQYLVRVRATDAGGRTADATIELNVRRANEAPPLARFSIAPEAPKSGEAVTFDASGSELSDTDGKLQGPVGANPTGVRFRWDFGDGTPAVATTVASVTHTYAGSGRPTAVLLIEDVRATPSTFSDPAEREIAVAPGASDANAPVASLVRQEPPPASPVFANRPITVTAAASTASPGHAPLTYAFDLDGDGAFERAPRDEPSITFSPQAAGPLTVTVKATDEFASTATASIALDVKPEPIAEPTVTLAGPSDLPLTGSAVDGVYDATGSKGNNFDPTLTYRWDLDGDGTFETPTGTDPKVTATFESPGTKTVAVRAIDAYGNAAVDSKTTIVRTAADIAAGCSGASSLQTVTFENVQLRGCVFSEERPSAGDLYVITGRSLLFNGMRLAPADGERPTPRPFSDCGDASCKTLETNFNDASAPWAVVLDTSDGSLRSNAPSSLRASGSNINLPLFDGPLNVSLPDLAEDGFTLATPPASELAGFPLAGGVTLKFPDPGETTITVVVELPAVAGGFTGEATVRVTATGGVQLDDLSIDVGSLAIGKLTFGELSFVYSRFEELWKGGASLTLPTPKAITVSAQLAIQRNRFKSISASVSGLNQPIAQAIFLQALRASISVDPLDLRAGVSLSAGPTIRRKSVLSVDGDMRLKFPSPAANYYLFALTGKLSVADFQLASAFAQFTSNGFFELGGGINANFEIGYARANLKGWLTSNAFNIDADATVGVTLGGTDFDLLGGHMTVSSTGFGACGEIPIIDVGGGFGARWAGGAEAFWGCDLAPYRTARPADAPATLAIRAGAKAPRTDALRGRLLLAGPEGHLLQVPADQEKALLTVTGKDAPPRVSIVDDAGTVLLSTPADGTDVLTKQMLVKTDPKAKTTTILWKAPPKGKAWVVEQAGSSAVTAVDMAVPAPKRKLDVSVSGEGRKRVLNWDITPALLPGETVSLAEEGTGAGTEIVRTAKSKGSVPFTPSPGTAAKASQRSIMAMISADGLPSTKVVSTTYTAPPLPVIARPAALALRRSSSGVLAKWTPGKGGEKATKWRLLVRVAHTQRKKLLVLDASKRSVRIPEVNPGDAVSVSITGSDVAGIEGSARSAIVKAGLRASSGPLAKSTTAKPTNVVVRRLAGGKLRVTWKTGGAFVRGWSVRVSGAAKGRRKGDVTLLRSAGTDHSVEFAKVPRGELRVSVIGRRFQGSSTRKDVVYLGGGTAR